MSPDKGVFARIAESDAAKGLGTSLSEYMTSRASAPLRSKASKAAEDATESVGSTDEQQGSGLMDRVKSGAGGGAVKGAIKGAIDAIKPSGGQGKRPHNITDPEPLYIGASIEQVWALWTDYEKWPEFMKGPTKVSIDENDDGDKVVSITGKVFLSTRTFKATITEEVEEELIRWTSEGPKGVIDGVITFTPMGDNLTQVVPLMEYRGKGPVEWIGNRWRAPGRRIRLDIKHLKRRIMTSESEDSSDEGGEGQPEGQPEGGESTDE